MSAHEEKGLQSACLMRLAYLENQGHCVAARTAVFDGMIDVPRSARRIKVRMQTGREGWPDITAVIHGKFVALEMKAIAGRQSPIQKALQTKIEKAGGIYKLIHSVDELEETIRELSKEVMHT